MSRHTARQVLDSMNMRPALVAARYARDTVSLGDAAGVGGMIADVRELASCNVEREMELAQRRRGEMAAAYGYSDYDEPASSKPFVFVDGKAIIPVHGLLINRFAYSWGFATGYNFIRAQVEAALADNDVDGLIYDVDTNGGTVAGCKETADIIYAASAKGGGKPSLAVIDTRCYSAGYYLMSGADRMVCTLSGGAGSIGVLLMHMDLSGMFDKMGVKVTFIASPEDGHKVDGNPFEPLSKGVLATLQAENDKMYGVFVGTVGRNRPEFGEQAARDTKARCFSADDALALGLIDSVATPPEALNAFFNGDDETDDNQEEPEMAVETKTVAAPAAAAPDQAALDAASATARTQERDRFAAILAHPEAVGRTELAQEIAMTTDLTPEAAGKLLAKSPKAAAPAAPPAVVETEKKKEPEANHFKTAMDNGKHPNVGADNGNEPGAGGSGEASGAASILGAYSKASGRKLVAAK